MSFLIKCLFKLYSVLYGPGLNFKTHFVYSISSLANNWKVDYLNLEIFQVRLAFSSRGLNSIILWGFDYFTEVWVHVPIFSSLTCYYSTFFISVIIRDFIDVWGTSLTFFWYFFSLVHSLAHCYHIYTATSILLQYWN